MRGLSGHCLYPDISRMPNLSATGAITHEQSSIASSRYSFVAEQVGQHGPIIAAIDERLLAGSTREGCATKLLISRRGKGRYPEDVLHALP